MPKKSFLERMGLVEKPSKPEEEEASLKEIQTEVRVEAQPVNVDVPQSVVSSPETVTVTERSELDEEELRNKLINDFNATATDSFGFVSSDVTVDDIIPPVSESVRMTPEAKELLDRLNAPAADDSAKNLSTGSVQNETTTSQNETPLSAVEEATFTETEKSSVPYHSQIAEELSPGELKAEENLKTPPSYKPDPYIGDKLDLIIGAYEKNRLLTIDEIYKNSRMETDTKKTIFMTDVFLQAIPANLPQDVKRETVLNILKISGIDLEVLLSDAYKRIDSLNKVLEETVSTSNDIYQRNENTIRELERRIQDLKEVNTARQLFQEDQNTMIQYEVQKIINLVEFVKPKTI